ncbi:pirin-like bicupin family protein [Paenibacillus sp. YYML68]|uniref:pirin family protein n=1 Tax=Paenibacillus sp. YYML68 TaxID=2909250 RepID=UPI0024909EB0|nr:pirin-like bicupin family protein [Paenibacillus sp. YYML68]
MIQVFPSTSRYTADHGWLKSNFSFSFADYYDPNNVSFGPLRVFNDDIVQGGRGFGAHPHREMEIVSIVLKGQLQHEDSTGHREVTTYGQVQRMSAGTGIIHSEVNPGEEEVHFLQIWFEPEELRLEPSYEATDFDTSAMRNRLLPIVSKRSGAGIAHIHQDLTIYLTELNGESVTFSQQVGRRIYVFVLEGNVRLGDGTVLGRRDAARIEGVHELVLTPENMASLVLIDLP